MGGFFNLYEILVCITGTDIYSLVLYFTATEINYLTSILRTHGQVWKFQTVMINKLCFPSLYLWGKKIK